MCNLFFQAFLFRKVYDAVFPSELQGLSYVMVASIKRFVSELPSKNYKTCLVAA